MPLRDEVEVAQRIIGEKCRRLSETFGEINHLRDEQRRLLIDIRGLEALIAEEEARES